jgi:signal peptide peptidase SppA
MNSEVLLNRITAEPVLLDPRGAKLFTACIEGLFNENEELASALMTDRMETDDFWDTESWTARYRPYNVTEEGILVIPVQGALVNKFPYQVGGWVTGYEYIEAALERGLSDSNVKGIALDIDSPGGVVAGNFELADKIFAARSEKPIRAFANDSAYSAAYSIASSASDVNMSRSGGVGSIGVVTMHASYEKMLEKTGIEVTFIYAGKHKVEGNAYEELSDEAKARIQKRIDKLYGVFVGTVARNRDIAESVVRDTEALTYDSDEAIQIGLADSVGTFAEELTRFSDELTEGYSMSKQETQEQATVSTDEHNKAVSAARAEGINEGATAERSRIQSILALDESANRSKAAMSVAMQTAMSVDEAKTFLASLPEEKAEEAKEAPKAESHFEKAMAEGNPDVGSAQAAKEGDAEASLVDQIKGSYRKAQGA